MPASPERFDLLLQDKLEELDSAAEADALLAVDDVEQLRLRAAWLVTQHDGRPWPTGAAVRFQEDPAAQVLAPPTLDIRHPARPSVTGGGTDAEGHHGRQGRRVP